jgi:adenine-specific DNA-methyltransferase
MSHLFKCIHLEQYEDALNSIEFAALDGTVQKRLEHFPDYFLSYVLDYGTRDSPTRLSAEQFKTPFNCKTKTISGGEEKEEPVDLIETFNYLLGFHVRKIRAYRDRDRVYRTVLGERDREQIAVIWRDMPGLDLERDKKFIEETILAGSSPDIIYVNGDSYVKNARSIEPEFGRLMCA